MSSQLKTISRSLEAVTMTALVPVWDILEEPRLLPQVGEFVCGSDAACDVYVSLKGVAPQHCRIFCHNGITTVVPVTGQRIWVNDALVTRPERLHMGDSLAVGPATFRVKNHDGLGFRGAEPAIQAEAENAQSEGILRQLKLLENRIEAAESTAALTDRHATRHTPSQAFSASLSDLPRTEKQSIPEYRSEPTEQIVAREKELDRRSNMLQQQLSLFKDRQRQFEEQLASASKGLESEKETFESERTRFLADIRAETEKSKAELQKRTTDLGRQSEALQRKHRSLEETSQRLTADRKSLDEARRKFAAQQQEIASANAAKRDEVENEANQLKTSAAEIAKQFEELHAHRNRIRTREIELVSFDEELSHRHNELTQRHDELERRNEELEQLSRKLQSTAASLVEQTESIDQERAQAHEDIARHQAALEDRQSDFSKRIRELEEREELVCSEQESLQQRAEELDEKTRVQQTSLAVEKEALKHAQHDFQVRQRQLEESEHALRQHERELQEIRDAADERRESESEATLQQLASVQAELQARDSEIAKLRAEFASSESIEALQSRLDAVAQREADVQNETEQLQAEAETVAEQARRLAENASQLDGDRAVHDQRVAEWEQQVRQTEETNIAKATELAAEQERLEAERVVLQEQMDQFSESQAQIRRLTEEQQIAQSELDAKAQEFTIREQTLASRETEVSEQIAELNRAETSTAASISSEAISVAEIHRHQEELEDARRQTESAIVEREELATALTELRSAFESAKDELALRNSVTADAGNELLEVQTSLSECESELESANRNLAEKSEQIELLQAQLTSLAERLETQQREFADQERANQAAFSKSRNPEVEEALLAQIEDLQLELSHATSDSAAPDEFAIKANEYEDIIRDLKMQLEQVATSDSSAQNQPETDEQLAMIAELSARLQEQEQTIQRLNSEASSINSEEPDVDANEIRLLHRELDERTNVLDGREEEIRERQRMLDQSEGEIESQRRELLEARQQLELARAEIQVAMESADEQTAPESEWPSEPQLETEQPASEDTPAVRSEIAELFGLGSANHSTEANPPQLPAAVVSDLPAVDEYSQEESAAVSMSFSEDASVLLEAPESASEQTEESDTVEDGDDFVASYMEQLLARNRANVAGEAPAELQKKETKEEQPQSTGPKSFIDAYMSGEYDSGSDDVTTPEGTSRPDADQHVPADEAPRAKIDLESLRTNMDSFRELSTRSVENALASHAKRQERGGIAARSTVFIALLVMTFFVIAAAIMEVIPFGIMVWATIVGTAISGGELLIKMWHVKEKVRQTAAPLNQPAQPDLPEVNSAATPGVSAPEVASEALDLTPFAVDEPTAVDESGTEESSVDLDPVTPNQESPSSADTTVVESLSAELPLPALPEAVEALLNPGNAPEQKLDL